MTHLKGLRADKHKAEKEASVYQEHEIAQERDADFRYWLKLHLIDHPEDAKKDEKELHDLYSKR